ncbi:MAG: transcription termination/antitermination protein NusG [Treponema sp.]|nr:transcription termination/antitermination protein NusG [Treponema sp.]
MATGWYVLHVYSGYEKKIKKVIEKMLETGDLEREVVRDIKIPSEKFIDKKKDGKDVTITRNFLPGYILVEMDVSDSDLGWKIPCSKIRNVQGVTGFVGVPAGTKPKPLSSDEARAILQKSGEMKGERTIRARQSFEQGEQVKITDGPFNTFSGVIDEVYADKNKLKVMVGIFGRNTPVEVDMMQVEKV